MRRPTGTRCPSRRCAGCAVRRTSCRSCSAETARCSTSAGSGDLATRAQRRALRAMYRSCAHPSCTVPFDSCRIHHVIYWEGGGSSDLDNLLPLCERHHHLVHEGGWTLQLFPDRRTTWRTSDGTVWFDGITTDRASPPTIGPRRPQWLAARKGHAVAATAATSRPSSSTPSPRCRAGRRRSATRCGDGRERITE